MGVRELRDTLTQTLRRVQGGETIEVTHHGAPVALLGPVPEGRVARLVAVGEVTPGVPLEHWPSRFPVTGEQSASAALEDDRAQR
jgi:prevent-host-death family protein